MTAIRGDRRRLDEAQGEIGGYGGAIRAQRVSTFVDCKYHLGFLDFLFTKHHFMDRINAVKNKVCQGITSETNSRN